MYRTKQESFQFVKNQTTKHEKNILVLNSQWFAMNWKDLDFHGQFDSGEWRKWGSQQWSYIWWQLISTGKTIKPGCFPKYWLIGWWTGAEFYTSSNLQSNHSSALHTHGIEEYRGVHLPVAFGWLPTMFSCSWFSTHLMIMLPQSLRFSDRQSWSFGR